MAKKSAIRIEKISVSDEDINRYLKEMLDPHKTFPRNSAYKTGYDIQFEIIKDSFTPRSTSGLRKVDVATRIALIDLFYSTNFNRFAEFALAQLTDKIWQLSSDADGTPSDTALVQKVEDFVRDCTSNPEKARKSEIFVNLFAQSVKFGVTDVKVAKDETKPEPIGYAAQSLISKYLFFLLETYHSSDTLLGFPIFDSIARHLQHPIYMKLTGKRAPRGDMVTYIANMTKIVDCLKRPSVANSCIWNMTQSVCNTQFGLLDYFLWRVGKSGEFSFSLLWTESEKIKHFAAANRLKHDKSDNPMADFLSLPDRFRDWYAIYNSIITKN